MCVFLLIVEWYKANFSCQADSYFFTSIFQLSPSGGYDGMLSFWQIIPHCPIAPFTILKPQNLPIAVFELQKICPHMEFSARWIQSGAANFLLGNTEDKSPQVRLFYTLQQSKGLGLKSIWTWRSNLELAPCCRLRIGEGICQCYYWGTLGWFMCSLRPRWHEQIKHTQWVECRTPNYLTVLLNQYWLSNGTDYLTVLLIK